MENIITELRNDDWTLEGIGELVDRSASTISRWERHGGIPPHKHDTLKLYSRFHTAQKNEEPSPTYKDLIEALERTTQNISQQDIRDALQMLVRELHKQRYAKRGS